MNNNEFRTFSEYMKKEGNSLTASMEDYLEMIYRLSINNGYTRMHELSAALNVHAPSATRMVQKLGELTLLQYEKYGLIILTPKGIKLGELLLNRHNTIESFLRLFNIPEENILKETEKVEHTLSDETIKCFEKYIAFIKDNPDVNDRLNSYTEIL